MLGMKRRGRVLGSHPRLVAIRALRGMLVALVGLLAGTGVAYAAPGQLDTSFGQGTGAVQPDFGGVSEFANAVALQPDGKIVAAGTGTDPGGTTPRVLVARFNPQGTLDTSYGLGTGASRPNAYAGVGGGVAVQPDGKIVAAGTILFPSETHFLVARFLSPQGTPDNTFGRAQNGVAVANLGGKTENASAVALQPDGKIVVAGNGLDPGGVDRFLVERFNFDGTLDISYGLGTGASRPQFPGQQVGRAVAVQPDGKILVAGITISASTPHFMVARFLNPQGTSDPSFGSGGGATIQFGNQFEDLNAMALQPDGKIVLAGDVLVNGQLEFAVARLLSTGIPDNSFGQGGTALFDLGANAVADAAALQPDGKIIVVGTHQEASGDRDIAAIRLLPAGTLDHTFGTAGESIVNLGGDVQVHAMALQADGKIVIAGSSTVPGGSHMLVVRLLGDPAGGGGGGGAPSLTGARMTHTRFAVDRTGPSEQAVAARRHHHRPPPKGTTFVYTLGTTARVVFRIDRALSGRRVGNSCRASSSRNRHHARCVRYVKVGAFAQQAHGGQNQKHWSGKIRRAKLGTGNYRASLSAQDAAGQLSKTAYLNFTIVSS
jgi:uncharacterized delta-60 repeat protein